MLDVHKHDFHQDHHHKHHAISKRLIKMANDLQYVAIVHLDRLAVDLLKLHH